MENNFEPRIIEKSLLLRSYSFLKWIYILLGLNLPSALYNDKLNTKSWKSLTLWCWFTLYICILSILVIWMVYINNVMVLLIVESYDLDRITGVLSTIQNIAVAFMQFVMHISTYRGRQCLIKIHKNIAQLEQDILMFHREFAADQVMGYVSFKSRCQRFKRRLLLRPFAFLLVHTLLLCYVNYPLINDMLTFRDKFLTIFSFQLIQTKCSEYCVMMYIMDEFLSTLQQSLLQLKYEMLREQRQNNVTGAQPSKMGGCSTYYGKLMAHQFLVNRVWCLIKHIEEYFSVPLLVLFIYNGVGITHTINWTYVRSFSYSKPDCCQAYRLWFIMLVIVNMFYTCWLSQICIDKYTQFGSILHNLKISCHDMASKHRLREYSLQMMHQKVVFTCSGFLDINLKSFGLLTLSITTYVVILIQFKLQAETEKGNRRL